MSVDVKKIVREKIEELGIKEASKLFGVSFGTVSNWGSGKTPPSADAIDICLMDYDLSAGLGSSKEAIKMWEGRKVMLGLPCYKSLNPHTHHSLFANYAKYGSDKIAVEVQTLTLPHEARNILTDKFLKSDCETLIMVDDDMILPVGNEWFMNTKHGAGLPSHVASRLAFSRILSHGKDKGIVGALYFGRHNKGRAQCSSGFDSNEWNKDFHTFKYDGLVPQTWVATGMIKVERWVFEKIKPEIEAERWSECKDMKGCNWKGYWNHIKTAVGEDASFGVRARELGIQSYVDAGLICLHMGETSFGPNNTDWR